MIVRELKSKYFRLCGIYGVCVTLDSASSSTKAATGNTDTSERGCLPNRPFLTDADI